MFIVGVIISSQGISVGLIISGQGIGVGPILRGQCISSCRLIFCSLTWDGCIIFLISRQLRTRVVITGKILIATDPVSGMRVLLWHKTHQNLRTSSNCWMKIFHRHVHIHLCGKTQIQGKIWIVHHRRPVYNCNIFDIQIENLTLIVMELFHYCNRCVKVQFTKKLFKGKVIPSHGFSLTRSELKMYINKRGDTPTLVSCVHFISKRVVSILPNIDK